MGWYFWYVIGLIVGAIATLAIVRLIKPKPSGTFYMDFSDPNKDICRLDLEEDPNDIYTKKYIILKVSTHE